MPDEPTDPASSEVNGAKPPFLRRVRIRNYKSIAFCDVTLEPLTILVGRNATGKSNFVDALGFLRDVFHYGANEAVQMHGGRDVVLCHFANSSFVEVVIETVHESTDGSDTLTSTLAVEVSVPAMGAAVVSSEQFRVCGSKSNQWTSYSVVGGRVTWDGWSLAHPILEWLDNDRPLIDMYRTINPFRYLPHSLALFAAYSFSPKQIRYPQKPSRGMFLAYEGWNLASVIEATHETDPRAAARAARYLNAIAESIQFAGIIPAGGYKVLEFDTGGNVDAWNGPLRAATRLPAASMSDGTLRAFACLMAAFQTVAPHGSPSLVAIEEPETALHPAAMRALVAAFDEATLRTQILLTTHSPDLLDAEEVTPANVRVVQLIDGKTVIGPVDEASVEIVQRELSTLGRLERENQLVADLDDRDRQERLAAAGAGG